MSKAFTRGEAAVRWVEMFCVCPSGPRKGKPVKLAPADRAMIYSIYDVPNGPQNIPVTDKSLAAFLALLHVCSPEALQQEFRPHVDVDTFTVWASCGPQLVEVLERRAERVICPALGTAYPAAA